MEKNSAVILETDFKDLKLFSRGKVRDTYQLDGDRLLMITTDRISAFDVVMPNGVPNKGEVLTGLSVYWFDFLKDIVENHFISSRVDDFPKEVRKYAEILEGRSMIVRKSKVIPVECVVRGYLAGSAWKEYQKSGTVCGIKLPSGIVESEKLHETIFTPSTKAVSGHDINLNENEAGKIVGKEVIEKLKELTVGIYEKAAKDALSKGVIISDTKFEFGFHDDRIILVDEVLTPDSSRFWPASDYRPGGPQKSFDKQYLRDYLESIRWDKTPPAPQLPEYVVLETSMKYVEAYDRITGRKFMP